MAIDYERMLRLGVNIERQSQVVANQSNTVFLALAG